MLSPGDRCNPRIGSGANVAHIATKEPGPASRPGNLVLEPFFGALCVDYRGGGIGTGEGDAGAAGEIDFEAAAPGASAGSHFVRRATAGVGRGAGERGARG